MKYELSVCWLRRDLRLTDNHALFEACRLSKKVVVLFVFDSVILEPLSKNDRRVTFIFDSLLELAGGLKQKGSQLLWVHGDPVTEVPKLAKKLNANAVFTNEDYEPYAKDRDAAVSEGLKQSGVEFCKFKDHVIFSGGEILKGDGTPYRVFTPYKNAWLKSLGGRKLESFNPDIKNLAPRADFAESALALDLKKIGFEKSTSEFKGGEREGLKVLQAFKGKLKSYEEARDFPALEGTSKLSVHLRFGTISVRNCVQAVLEGQRSAGAATWLSEIVWRDFFSMILDQFPFVEKTSFIPQYRDIKWPGKKEHFEAWCKGKTGFPIVDAAMRQLNLTGWMHNRMRMVVASFLVKDLLIDWREGEKYFADLLMDYDLSSNNGGWQWCASTGCDPQPYFRIFNPLSQSQKFDERGDYIRKYVPELKSVEAPLIHQPPSYIPPIVDHAEQRDRALELFKSAKLG